MTTPPVTLGEFRAFLNLDTSDVADDNERTVMLEAAAEAVEAKCGAMVSRTVTARVKADGDGNLLLQYPVLSVASLSLSGTAYPVAGLDESYGVVSLRDSRLSSGVYDIVYVVGRSPVPASLRVATMIVADHLWRTQRGPESTTRYANNAGDFGSVPRGFALPNRAMELLEPYQQLAFA